MSRPSNLENLQSLQDTIVWAAKTYGVTSGTVFDNLDVSALGKNVTNPPAEDFIDNVFVLKFTVGTDKVHKNFPKPSDYTGTAGIDISYIWTNDGGVDDNDKDVKGQITYQVSSAGDAVDGTLGTIDVEDTYASASGYIEHKSGAMTIPHAAFTDETCIYITFSFEAPAGTGITCEPHLIGLCISYAGRTFS